MTFVRKDLDRLERLLDKAEAVVPMRDVWQGSRAVIGLRHDVDDNRGSLDTALAMAEWEHARGFRSTYFLLHDSHYWQDVGGAALELVALGHEVGLHVNAIAEAIRQQRRPIDILAVSLAELREGVPVVGMVAHGDALCHTHRFVNDELFVECRRPGYGPADRTVGGVRITPVPMRDFGIAYDANWLPRAEYLSESGGAWTRDFDEVLDGFPFTGQLHILQHPDWWAGAFVREPARG